MNALPPACLRVAIAIVSGGAIALLAWLAAVGSAPAATPAFTGAATPTAAPEATATPDPSKLRVRVVNDLDRDGVVDPDEPGLAGWQLISACGDALSRAETDTEGYAYSYASTSAQYPGVIACVRIARPFGWLATSPVNLQVPDTIDRAVGVTFLVHDLGRTVMEASGEQIVAGLPAGNVQISREAPPFAGGGEGCVETFEPYGPRVLLIVGADVRPGCPTPGAAFDILMEGEVAASLAFVPGQQVSTAFVIRGDSMRFGGNSITSAQIDGLECGVVIPHSGGLTPPGSVSVYVLSAEVRAGCGTPGALVRFFREGRPLEPLVPWRAGTASYPEFPELNFAPEQVIVPPTTGNAGLKASSGP